MTDTYYPPQMTPTLAVRYRAEAAREGVWGWAPASGADGWLHADGLLAAVPIPMSEGHRREDAAADRADALHRR